MQLRCTDGFIPHEQNGKMGEVQNLNDANAAAATTTASSA
jgi:hypothetical protein